MTPVYWFHYTPDALIVAATARTRRSPTSSRRRRRSRASLTHRGLGAQLGEPRAHERFNRVFGVKTTYVPFKGTGDLISSVLGGHVSRRRCRT